MANTAVPAMCCSRGFAAATGLFFLFSLTLSHPSSAEVQHVRHKRTVSDLMEGLMNAMYFHVQDPMPLPSTVIARITHLTAPNQVYKYVPVQTLKLSKLRARQIAEPKLRLKYPKKISIATEDSSLTLLKNDLPWTLHPLPPPLPTSKTIKLEVDKSMPWALHPLPPPVKTKNYSDYYWPDSKIRPKSYYRSKPSKPFRYTNNNYNYKKPKVHANFKPTLEYSKPAVEYHSVVDHNTKPNDYNSHADYKPVDYNSNNKHNDNNNHVDYPSDSFKYIDYKHVDYKHVDYKSPDYKSEYPKHTMDEDTHENNNNDDHYDQNDVYHYSHDDHSAQNNDLTSPSSQSPPSTEYVSHITIEPSIQIASFSESELQGDGTNRDSSSVSQGDAKHHRSCQCTINGHRHKRDVGDHNDGDDNRHRLPWAMNGTTVDDNEDYDNENRTAIRKPTDSNAAQSSRNGYFAPRVGHATDVQIIKSHDITDQSMINGPRPANGFDLSNGPGPANGPGLANGMGYVQQVRNMNNDHPVIKLSTVDTDRGQAKKNDAAAFRDESDKFKVEFNRNINDWEKSKSAGDKQGRYSSVSPEVSSVDGGSGGINSGIADDYGNRPTRDKPDTRGRGYHAVRSKVENSDRGVSFSVQTPFSVSSFSSNVRHPEEHQSRFRYTGHKSDSSSSLSPAPLLSSFQDGYSKPPLEFEQFGLKSALGDDHPLSPDHFSRDLFEDKSPETVTIGRISSRFPESFGTVAPDRRPSSGFSDRPASYFSRDFGHDDRNRLKTSLKPFRYNAKHGPSQSVDNLFDIPSKGGRPSNEESVLEYFQPVVIDFDKKSKQDDSDFLRSVGGSSNNYFGGNDRSRHFGKTENSVFAKLKKNQNSDQLRLPGRLHESNENLSRKMVLHPSAFDID